ncbi:MAG: aspartate-semialdehyde dehydrogenase [Gloeomargarita sp. GMQP_bins_5]
MGYRVGILGATGAVGTEMRQLLAERQFPVRELRLLASPRSAGQALPFQGEMLPVRPVSAQELAGLDMVLASAGAAVSREWAPVAVQQGAVVIDNSSAFRLREDVPLVVPEVNPQALAQHRGLIANPNCTTILLCVAIYPLHRVQPLQRVVVATYQSASGAGARAMQELLQQTRQFLDQQPLTAEVFPYPLEFNLFPHNSSWIDQGYCQDEMKMIHESSKIMWIPHLRLTASCVRVPVLRAHAEAVNLEFAQPFPVEQARAILQRSPGVTVVEDWPKAHFPMPLEASGKDAVLVGRIRQDLSHPCGLELWLCGDQIRKGAALNAIQIAELLIQKGWL